MKLATYHDGSRDGQLLVVARDLHSAHFTSGIATRMQQLLDDWNFLSPQLRDLYHTLNQGKARHAFAFDPARCMAPLPRAYQWVGGPAGLNAIELLDRMRGTAAPADPTDDPPLYQGGSDALLGPGDDAVFAAAAWGIDFAAELAVVSGDVAPGTGPDAALDSVRLLLLANAWSLRELEPAERAQGFGLVQSRPATAFAPLAVTPDELGSAWRGGRAHLRVEVARGGRRVGNLDAGAQMRAHFGKLIAHLARTRRLAAGSIVGGGTVGHGDAAAGCACIAEQRAHEVAAGAEPLTAYLGFGERVRIEAFGDDGQSVFGAIDQRVAQTAAAV